MYRNIEGYASPTEGAAYAHIIHEEHMRARKHKTQTQVGKAFIDINAEQKPKVRMIDKPDMTWTLAWSRNDMNKQTWGYAAK